MKKILVIFITLITLFSCNKSVNKDKIMYSNLSGEISQRFIKDILLKNGIKEDNVNSFLSQVNLFNKAVESKDLIDEFKEIDDPTKIEYNIEYIIDKFKEKYPNFEGCNCRITSFTLIDDVINIENTSNINGSSDFLFLDKDSLENIPLDLNIEKDKFLTLYTDIPTELTKDYNIHLKNIQNEWKNRKISFKDSNVSMISVFLHSDLDEPSMLFIGHIGILIKNECKFIFIEKLSFQDPYQVFIFNNKIELNDYLMTHYDKSFDQPTAHTILLENDKLLETYKIKENVQK
ncbi:DUF4300 family protein [Streptobacillus moniliformis]|uniref:DUF4300 family protein n=1 Tax=Streptobacillus moniliformis TaxID=34105 RepID=UPI0007E49A7F|nr:DUF4300 family protein [Streptobacillus moniliformis]